MHYYLLMQQKIALLHVWCVIFKLYCMTSLKCIFKCNFISYLYLEMFRVLFNIFKNSCFNLRAIKPDMKVRLQFKLNLIFQSDFITIVARCIWYKVSRKKIKLFIFYINIEAKHNTWWYEEGSMISIWPRKEVVLLEL